MRQFILFMSFFLMAQAAFGDVFLYGSKDGAPAAINLTNKIANNSDARSIIFGTLDPSASAVNAADGSLYISSSGTYQKTDAGSSTNWVPLLSAGAGTGTDECVARWNGTGVFLLQNSVFCITDAGVGTGLTDLTVGNLQVSGNTLASSNANGSVILNPNGTGQVNLPDLTPSAMLGLDGSSNVVSRTLTNGQLLIGSTGAAPSAASLTGTANQITVTPGAGSITLSTPQDIATTSSVEFGQLDVDDLRLSGSTVEALGAAQDITITSTKDVLLRADTAALNSGRVKFSNGTDLPRDLGSRNPELPQMMLYPSFEESVAELQCDNCSGFAQQVSTGVEGELYGFAHARASYGGATIDTVFVMPGTNFDDDMPATVSCWINTGRAGVTFRFSNTTDGDSDSQAVSSGGTWARYIASGTCRAGIGEGCGWKIVDNTAEAGAIDINGCSIELGVSPGVLAVGTIDSATKVANGAVISGKNIVLQTADNDDVGLVSILAQSFAGLKTFLAGLTSNADINLTAQSDLRLQDSAGGQYVALQSPATVSSSYTITLPDNDGDSGEFLGTDGSGVGSWTPTAKITIKILSANSTTNGASLSGLASSALVVGKWYRLSGLSYCSTIGAGGVCGITFTHNGSNVHQTRIRAGVTDALVDTSMGYSFVFQAATTSYSVTTIVTGASTTLTGNSTRDGTYVVIEELASVDAGGF